MVHDLNGLSAARGFRDLLTAQHSIVRACHAKVAWPQHDYGVLLPFMFQSPWILMPVLTNIAFSPSLLAFFFYKKKSRFLILILNVIVIGMTVVIYGGNINERFEPAVWPTGQSGYHS